MQGKENGNSGPPKPVKKRNRLESRRRILQAGLEVFSELGYDAATTKMIAQRAGLNESLLQRYFESKAGLLFEINRLSIEAMRNQKPYPPQETPEEEIYQFMKSKMEHDEKIRNFIRVIISRVLVDHSLRKEFNKQVDLSIDTFFLDRLKAFQKKGSIQRGVDIKELFYSVLSQSFAVGLMERIIFKKSSEYCQKQFRIFARSIIAGIAPH